MDKHNIQEEVARTIGLMDSTIRLKAPTDFAGKVNCRIAATTSQARRVMRYKFCTLAAVLLVTVLNIFAVGKALTSIKADDQHSADNSTALLVTFEQSRLGVFWPIN